MTIRPKQVAIQSPCPVDLDPNRHRGGRRSFHCGHCDKGVHILSNMTEAEARSLLKEKAGQDICVSYAIKPDGKVRFLEPAPKVEPSLVPITALTSRRRAVAAVAAVGLSAALAACAPHDNPKVQADEVGVQSPSAKTNPEPSIPDAQPREEDVMVDGGLKAEPDIAVAGGIRPPPDDLVDGGIEAVPLDEPCETEKPATAQPSKHPDKHRRGGMRARPTIGDDPDDPLSGL